MKLVSRWIRVLATAVAAVFLAQTSIHAQDGERPFLRDQEQFGRPDDAFSLRFCIDTRDPGWQTDKAIGEAVADALLLQAKPFIIESSAIESDEEEIYRHLLTDCRLYFGFKLIAQAYPDWLTVTRPLYETGYAFLALDPGTTRLADIPSGGIIAATLGSSADLRLIQYNNSLPPEKRWKRVPLTSDKATLDMVLAGEANVALVWAPTFAQLSADQESYKAFHRLDPAPLSFPAMPVGAILLVQDTHLRVSVDRAISDLIADGTIDRILKAHGMPTQTNK